MIPATIRVGQIEHVNMCHCTVQHDYVKCSAASSWFLLFFNDVLADFGYLSSTSSLNHQCIFMRTRSGVIFRLIFFPHCFAIDDEKQHQEIGSRRNNITSRSLIIINDCYGCYRFWFSHIYSLLLLLILVSCSSSDNKRIDETDVFQFSLLSKMLGMRFTIEMNLIFFLFRRVFIFKRSAGTCAYDTLFVFSEIDCLLQLISQMNQILLHQERFILFAVKLCVTSVE